MTNPVRRINSAAMKLILRDLADGPATVEDLCAVLHVSRDCVQKNLKVARDHCLVLVVGWERTAGDLCRVYGLRSSLNQREAKRPSRLSLTEYSRRARAKQSTTPEQRDVPA